MSWKDPVYGAWHTHHDIANTFDDYIEIIERDGWTWERYGGCIFASCPYGSQLVDSENLDQGTLRVYETGDRLRDFATAALAAEKARRGTR